MNSHSNMTPSIISNEKECYICKCRYDLNRHHLYKGAKRNKSEQWGLWIYLCVDHHTRKTEAVHNNPKLDKELKKMGQEVFEKKYPNKDFLSIFGKNYK